MPGALSYTRGVYPTMYRSRLWTMRQYSSFVTAWEMNRRVRYLLNTGERALNRLRLEQLHALRRSNAADSSTCVTLTNTLRHRERRSDTIDISSQPEGTFKR